MSDKYFHPPPSQKLTISGPVPGSHARCEVNSLENGVGKCDYIKRWDPGTRYARPGKRVFFIEEGSISKVGKE